VSRCHFVKRLVALLLSRPSLPSLRHLYRQGLFPQRHSDHSDYSEHSDSLYIAAKPKGDTPKPLVG